MTFKLQPNVETREIRGEFVVIDTRSGNYHTFNAVGGLMWQGLAEGKTPAAIVEAVVSKYKVTPERAALDLDAFIQTTRSFGLLE